MGEPCKRCEGSGKRLIPSVTGKAENRGTVFVAAPCGLCGGSGQKPPDRVAELEKMLATLLDQVDYTSGACRMHEMVGAVLPRELISLCRKTLKPDHG